MAVIVRPIPDIELHELTRGELYNRIYTLREDKDNLKRKLEIAVSDFETIATYPTVTIINLPEAIKDLKQIAREALKKLEEK